MDSAVLRKAWQNKGEVNKWEQRNFITKERKIANTGQYYFALFN